VSDHLYKLHDLTVRITRPRAWPPWVFQKLDYFAASPTQVDKPNIDITLGPFHRDTSGMLNVDHRYFGREGELCFVGRWNGLRYTTHWSGLHSDHVKVKLDVSPMGLARFPWLAQADWIAHLFVIKPISEWLWARRGRYVLHAAAAERDGEAAMFCGFGSSLKTSFVMQLVRDGWALLGDDQVLLTDDGLLPLPIGLRTFDFRVHHLPDEYLTRARTMRLAWHLWRRRQPRVRVSAGPAKLAAVNLLTRSDSASASWRALGADEAASRIVAQCRAETLQSVRRSPPIGEPMMALALMDARVGVDQPWDALRDGLARRLAGVAVRDVVLTRRWDEGLMSVVALGGEGGG